MFKLALQLPTGEPIDLGQWPVRTAFERTALVRVEVSVETEQMLLLAPAELRIRSSDGDEPSGPFALNSAFQG